MKMDHELDGILAEIGREHRAIAAPDRIEAALCAAARRQEGAGVREMRLSWAWAFVLLLAVLAGSGAVWQLRRSHGTQDRAGGPERVQAVPVRPEPASAAASHDAGGQARARRDARPVSGPEVRANLGARRRVAARRVAAGDSLQEFVLLPVSEGLPPPSELSVVRTQMLGSDLRQYGLEAPADAAGRPLLAEFVIGDDGLPRAIRIVH
jgi:hypothetical protein